ncbi:unnamed protein product, partial [Ectocarpus sp. 13 AM-2016]
RLLFLGRRRHHRGARDCTRVRQGQRAGRRKIRRGAGEDGRDSDLGAKRHDG